ncbi:MAG: 6-phospho-3-hexuloisomerase [Candidatus Thermoplasmatota archaeon]|nr:6-phospho-3-hexuloisomerase [Candidatus Thermoplasmatota archaeon]
MIFKDCVAYLTQKIKEDLDKLDECAINDMVESFFECDKMFIYGVGRSGLASKGFAMRLMHLGFKIYVMGETVSPPVNEGDLVILVSGSGRTNSVVKIAQLSKEVRAKIVVITAEKNSPLADLADLTIALDVQKDKNPKLAPLGTLFEDGSLVFFDCIISELLDRMGENEDRMTARHASLE